MLLLRLKFLENKNTFNEEEWAELYKLSENTYVEETDDLKQKSAGAGLTDNDWRWYFKRIKPKRFRGFK